MACGHPLGNDTYSLSNYSMADGAFGLVPLADAVGTLHAEQVVAAGHQSCDHLALEAHRAVPTSLAARPRWGWRGGWGGWRDGRVGGNARVMGSHWVTGKAERASTWIAAHPARQWMLGRTIGLVQRRGQPGLVGSALQPVGIRGSIGGENGWRGRGAVGSALILWPHQARRCRGRVESRRWIEGQVSTIGRDHLTTVDKSIVVIVVVVVAGGSVAEGGAWRAVIGHPRAAIVAAKIRIGRGTP